MRIKLADNMSVETNTILKKKLGNTPYSLERRDEALRQVFADELQDFKNKVVIAKDDPTFANAVDVMKATTVWVRLAEKADPEFASLPVFQEMALLEHEVFSLVVAKMDKDKADDGYVWTEDEGYVLTEDEEEDDFREDAYIDEDVLVEVITGN